MAKTGSRTTITFRLTLAQMTGLGIMAHEYGRTRAEHARMLVLYEISREATLRGWSREGLKLPRYAGEQDETV